MVRWNAILLWPWRFALANPAQRCADLSRLLLGFAFIELFTMPITQHLWTWDHFLRGGQDFELGLFIIITCLCLVLLRAQHCRQTIRRLLTFRGLIVLALRCGILRLLSALRCAAAAVSADPPFPRSSGAFLSPLQI